MDILFTVRSLSISVRPGFSKLNFPFLYRTREKTGLISPTRLIRTSCLVRGMSLSPILIFSTVTTSAPPFRTLTFFSDMPKPGKRTMPNLPLIRTSIPMSFRRRCLDLRFKGLQIEQEDENDRSDDQDDHARCYEEDFFLLGVMITIHACNE